MTIRLRTLHSRIRRLSASLGSAPAEAGQTAAEYAVLLGILCTMVVGAASELAPAIQERFSALTDLGVTRSGGGGSTRGQDDDGAVIPPRVTELIVADVQVVAHDMFTLAVTGSGEPWATRIELTNPSSNLLRHEARILANPTGLPVEQVELRGGVPYLGGAAAIVQLGPLAPGEEELLTLAIPPGEYTLVCAVVDGGVSHLELGMVATFSVGTAE